MSILELSEVTIGDGFEDPYWRFTGQDWIWFSLSKEESDWIDKVGKLRNDSRKNSSNNFAKGNSLIGNIHGVCGEYVVSQYLNEPINQISVLKDRNKADVKNYAVKATKYDKNWRIYDNESTIKRDRIYILVMTAFYPKTIAIMGWCYGDEINNGPEQMGFREREKAYWTSWHTLKPMSDIPN